MRWKLQSPSVDSAFRFLASAAVAVALCGCGSHESATQALDRQFKENPEFKRKTVVPFHGTVLVDGQPPQTESKLFVILNEFEHLDANAHAEAPKLYATCDSNGDFAFTTYERGDGVAAGKYVVTFLELHDPGAVKGTGALAFKSGRRIAGGRVFKGSDELKNLYNDPDKNSKESRFVVDLKPAGTDKANDKFDFNLEVAGKDAVPAGPNAVTTIRAPH